MASILVNVRIHGDISRHRFLSGYYQCDIKPSANNSNETKSIIIFKEYYRKIQ